MVNTDSQVLAQHLCTNRMQIGVDSTRGLGCGGNPEVGRIAAEESQEGLKKVGELIPQLLLLPLHQRGLHACKLADHGGLSL